LINSGDADLYVSFSDIPTVLNNMYASENVGKNSDGGWIDMVPYKGGNQDLTVYFSAYGYYASDITVVTVPFKTFMFPYNDKVIDSQVDIGNYNSSLQYRVYSLECRGIIILQV
jgi:hypothetical protein